MLSGDVSRLEQHTYLSSSVRWVSFQPIKWSFIILKLKCLQWNMKWKINDWWRLYRESQTIMSSSSLCFGVCKSGFCSYPLVFQMLFLATFFPTWEGGAGVYDFVGVSENKSKIKYTFIILACLRGWCVCVCLPGIYEGNSGPGGPVGPPSCNVS